MSISRKEQVYRVIREHGRGWVFCGSDLRKYFKPQEIDLCLSLLVKSGDIRRVIRGIYYYPEYNGILHDWVSPDIYRVAKTLARKFCWNIYPDGNTVLNYFGLSTQVVAKNIYLSNGLSRIYHIGGTSLIFQHIPNKEVIKKSEKATIVIQAIKAWGKVHATGQFVTSLSGRFSAKEWEKIAECSQCTTDWIYDVIKKARDIAINKECDLPPEAIKGIEDGLKSMEENRGIPLEQIDKK